VQRQEVGAAHAAGVTVDDRQGEMADDDYEQRDDTCHVNRVPAIGLRPTHDEIPPHEPNPSGNGRLAP
jgi:hypothetical protein